jgi:hypothetical protein
MLTNFRAKDLQQPCRFPSEGLLATPAVLIPLAPAASHQNRPWSESLSSRQLLAPRRVAMIDFAPILPLMSAAVHNESQLR